MDVLERINKLCKERGITRKRMEAEAGLSNGSTSKWKKEGFQPGYSSLTKLSEYFGVSVDYLLGFENAAGDTEMNKLKELRKNAGYSQAELAKKLSVHQTLISQIERGTVIPSGATLIEIAEFFGVTTDYLLGRNDNSLKKRIAVRIPVFARVPAGIPLEAIEDIVDYEEIPAEMLQGDHEYFGVIVHGDSMYPKYIDGDIVIVKKQSVCESGQDCIVYINGYEATLKTVHFLPDGGIRLQPINTSYMPKTYYQSDEPVIIVGVVVQIRRNV